MAVNRPREAVITPQDTLLTLAQAAEYLGLSQAAFEAALHRNEIAPLAGTSDTRFSIADLDLFLDNQRVGRLLPARLAPSPANC